MSDAETLRRIDALVGQPCFHVMEDGQCVEISLASDAAPYHGLIRHHAAAVQQEILCLIGRLSGLRRLNLRRNHVRHLPDVIGGLTGLEQLVLGSNRLAEIPDLIRNLHGLRSLHLGSNEITEVPGWLGEMENLEYLTLHKNFLIRSLAGLKGLRRLHTLNLFLLRQGTLPEFIYENTRLRTLTLWGVTDFPAGLDCLPELEFFSLGGCRTAVSLPPGLTRLRKLRMSRLHQNGFERLPEDIGDLTQLEQLTLYQNKLRGVPDSMASLTSLKKLNLGWNRFDSLPHWLGRLPNLEWLGVFGNPLPTDWTLPERAGLQVVRERPFTTL